MSPIPGCLSLCINHEQRKPANKIFIYIRVFVVEILENNNNKLSFNIFFLNILTSIFFLQHSYINEPQRKPPNKIFIYTREL